MPDVSTLFYSCHLMAPWSKTHDKLSVKVSQMKIIKGKVLKITEIMAHLLEYCGPFYSFCGNRWRGRYQELVLTGCCIPHAVNVMDMKCNKLFIRYSWGVVVLFIISCKFFEYYNSLHVRIFSLFKPLIQKQPKNI